MAIKTITYNDKTFLNQNTSIADENKVNDTDLNQIKDVVNTNANNIGDLSNLNEGTTIVDSVNGCIGDVLWTNSNTTSNFISQNVNLNTAPNYDVIGVWLYRNTTNAELEEIRIKNGTGGSLIFGELFNNILYIQGRNFNFTNSTTMNFSGGFLHATNGNTTSNDNSRGIPKCIVGYKTGIFS